MELAQCQVASSSIVKYIKLGRHIADFVETRETATIAMYFKNI